MIRMEHLAGIRHRTVQRTARSSGGAKNAKARKNNHLIATWTFHQRSTFIAYKAERAGIAVEWVDPAYTSSAMPGVLPAQQGDRPPLCVRGLRLGGASGRGRGNQYHPQGWPAW
ncbi:MAG TPA: IS200/IS605 family accessory protein TnpB-related protein [Ktedonobacterales bacterium]|nr:IS200/IS605 family accessory protein TnpB-related protein [Ktedonobacterales bacterium]